jgi:glycosyltransferase involved in cell wall biosynthesis
MNALLDARLGRRPTGIGYYVLHLAEEVSRLTAPGEFAALTSWRWLRHLGRRGVNTVYARAGAMPARVSQVDLVHGPNYHAPAHPRARAVTTIHDLGFITLPECHPPGMPERLDGLVRASLRRTDRFICVSADTRDEFVAHYGVDPDRCAVVPHGVSTAAFHERAAPGEGRRLRRRYGVERPFVLFVGAIVPRKDVLTLCRAFELLHRDHPELELVLAGNKARRWASDYERIEAWLSDRPAVRARVRWLDYVRDGDLPALYRRSSVVALTSLTEGFGMTVLEGLATGRPVVASRAGALPEIGGDAVRYAAPRDAEGFAEQLRRALEDDCDSVRLSRARAIVARRTWPRTAEATLAVYRSAVE